MQVIQKFDAADQARRWMSSAWLAVVVGSIYILAAKLSLALLSPTAWRCSGRPPASPRAR